MNKADVKEIVKNDVLIWRIGSLCMEGLGDATIQKQNYVYRVSQAVGTLARLVKQTCNEKPVATLLTKDTFDIVIQAAKAIAFEDGEALIIASKIGHSLWQTVVTKIGQGIRT